MFNMITKLGNIGFVKLNSTWLHFWADFLCVFFMPLNFLDMKSIELEREFSHLSSEKLV